MAGFLRRLRRRTDAGEGEPAPEETEPTEGSETLPTEPEAQLESESSPSVAEETLPSSAPMELVPVPPAGPGGGPEPISAPPPLPEADQEAARGSMGRRGTHLACFLCGTSLEGSWCPTCRMAWVE